MISIQNLSKCFEKENLYEEINLVIHPNNRITLVGKNGSGKSTFLKCLTNKEDYEGMIQLNGTKIVMMEQENYFENLNISFTDYLEKNHKDLENKKVQMTKDMENPEIYKDENKFNDLLEEYDILTNNQSLEVEESKLKNILSELGIDEVILAKNIIELSGGQKMKLRLAECLSKNADLYLLDEPTNNLDLETSKWLIEYIKKFIPSLIVISHDKFFLSQITEEVWKIEDKKITKYPGSYDNYLKGELINLELLKEKYKDASRRKERLLDSAKEKRHWASLAGNKMLKSLADRLEREAEEIELGTNPKDFVITIPINFINKTLHNCELFRLRNISKEFDGKLLFSEVTQEIDQGEKIAIVGKNGSGKSTLLKLLLGQEKPTGGKIETREGLNIGYFDQELTGLDPEESVISFLENEVGKNKELLISGLSKFNFEKEFLHQKIGKLSGGEKGRLNILRIALQQHEVLFLDEPTNNLDISLKESLEDAIKIFPGTVVIISHDIHFMNAITTRVFEIKNKKISSYKGNYDDYLEQK